MFTVRGIPPGSTRRRVQAASKSGTSWLACITTTWWSGTKLRVVGLSGPEVDRMVEEQIIY